MSWPHPTIGTAYRFAGSREGATGGVNLGNSSLALGFDDS